MKYEEALKKLEAIVDKMERGDMNIDTMANELKKAQELIKVCKDKLTHTDEEIKKLQSIYKPYMVNCKMRDDAPIEAVEAFEKFKEWVNEQYRLAGME